MSVKKYADGTGLTEFWAKVKALVTGGSARDNTKVAKAGDTMSGSLTIQNILNLYRSGTTANNYPAGIVFKLNDTTTGKTYEAAHIYAYQDHQATPYGTNMVLHPGGGLFIGSGESPQNHYDAKGASYAGEDSFFTADGVVNIQANGNTIANRLGMQMTTGHQLVPIKSDSGANNSGSIGSSGVRWHSGYFYKMNQMLTGGTNTAAQDKGSGVSPRYFPAKWTFNTGITPADGDVVVFKMPGVGHDYGVFLSTNNGANYYPVILNGTSRLTTHHPSGQILAVVFESSASATSIYPVAGGDARVTVDGGCWRLINWYDANTSTSCKVDTDAGTAAKSGWVNDFVLKNPCYAQVIMRYANTYAGAITLNINGTGAKPIYINGVASGASNYSLPAGCYIVRYNGTYFDFRTDNKLPADITGDAATVGGRHIYTSTSEPTSSDGANGDIWLVYESE